jgi:hypothetical protein
LLLLSSLVCFTNRWRFVVWDSAQVAGGVESMQVVGCSAVAMLLPTFNVLLLQTAGV